MRLGNVAHALTMARPEAGELTQMAATSVTAGFSDVYARHYAAVFRAALRVTGNPADAEDVLQTVFLRVLAHSDQDDVARRPAAYFRRAAVNAAVDLLRRRKYAEAPYDEGASHVTIESPVLLKEQLRRAVATLPDNDATLFLLRHVEGLSLDELADLFQLQKNNVAVRLHRIRLRLQAEMQR